MTKDKNLKRTLSIRISTDGFCFCDYIPSKPGSLNYFFYNTDKEKSLAVNFRAGFEEAPFADKENYSCIKCIVETAEFTAIPLEYDDRSDYKQFFKHCFPHGNSNAEIVANRLNAQGYTIIFPVDKGIYEEISSLGETSIYTPASILAGFITNAPFNEERYMLAYFQGKHALFLSTRERKAELMNIFGNTNSQDTLFYMLSMWKEQGFSQTNDTLYICGDNSIEEIMPAVGKFIKNIKRINPNEIYTSNLLNRLEGIPFDLQTLILCE